MIALAAGRRTAAIGWALGAAAVGVLYADVLRALFRAWWVGSYHAYMPLVPLFSAWLVWEARERLRGPLAWWWPGLAVTAAGVAALAAGGAADSLTLRAASLPVTLAGLALVGLGPARFGSVAFPVGFLAFLTPLPDPVLARLSLPLQELATAVAERSLAVLGIPFAREGLLIHLEPVTLHISEACNGLRFLLAMIVLSVAFAGAVLGRPGPGLLLVVGGIVLAVAANQVRVTGTALLAHAWGPAAATGLPHVAWGKAVYLAALLPFAALVLGLRGPGRLTPPR